MQKLGVLGLAATIALFGALISPIPAAAAGSTTCKNQTLLAVTVVGNLIVPAGAFCDLQGTHVTGNADVKPNAGLLAENGAVIDGTVFIERAGQFAAFAASTVGGNVLCFRCGVADLHNSTVKGSLVDFGMTLGAFIESSQIVNSVVIFQSQDGGSGFTVTGNSIGGDFLFARNRGSSTISANTIAGELDCRSNTPPPTGAGNTASEKEGQCAGL